MHEPDRLAELRRQRALVQQHLEWLDREIAAESGQSALSVTTPAKNPVIVPAVAIPVRASINPVSVPIEPSLEEQPRPASDVRQDVKRGCLLYFAAALAAVVFSVAILYFAFGVGRR